MRDARSQNLNHQADPALDAIRSRLSMLDLLRNDGVEMRRSGPNHVGFCPFHVENTPSFTVHADDQHAHCYGCGWHGDQIAYLQARRNLDFIAARNLAATITGRVKHVLRLLKHFESGQWQKQKVALAQSKPGPKFV
jgi:DNA primase